MADNVTFQPVVATPPTDTVVSTEEVTTLNGGAVAAQHAQRIIVALRLSDGTAIDLPGTLADGVLVNLGSNNDVTVTGTVTANLGTIAGIATSAKQDTEIASLASLVTQTDGVETSLTSILAKILTAPATEAKQDTGNTSLASIDTKIDALTTPTDTQPISAASLPLPTGAATSANQATEIASLASLVTQTDAVEASLVSILAKIIAAPATEAKQDTGNTSLASLVTQTDAIEASLTSIDGGTPAALGQAVMADSTPVVIASNQTAVPVSLASTTITGTVTADTELPAAAALADNTANPTAPAVGSFVLVWDGANWDRLPGNSTDGALVNLGANNDVTVTGTVTANLGTISTAATAANQATEIASLASLVTQTDAIEASLASIDAGTPAALGQTTMANSQPVVIASDQAAVPVTLTSTTITGTVDTELPAAAALADNAANPTAPAVGAFAMVWDGANWDRLPGASADGALVNLGSNNDVTVTSGTVTANLGTIGAAATEVTLATLLTLAGFQARINTFGQKTSANSTPVVLASDQSAIALDAATLAALETINAAQSGTWILGANSGVDIGDVTINNAAGAAAVNIQDGGNSITIDGTVTATPTGTYTTKETRAATSAVTSVADTDTNTTLLASNAARLGATIYNESTVDLHAKLGATASLTSYTIKIAPSGYYEVPFGYTGIIDGIWTSNASGNARMTELSA